MHRVKVLGILAGLLMLAQGCTGHAGLREPDHITKRLVFEANNFRVAKSKLQASHTCGYLFPNAAAQGLAASVAGRSGAAPSLIGGILGSVSPGGIALGNPELYEQTYAKLREQAALEGKAAQLYNITEEITVVSYLGIYGTIKLTVTADVIEFTDEYVDYKNR